MDELITFLSDKTHMGRFSALEIGEVINRLDEGGWEIVRKADGVIVQDHALESLETIPRSEFTPYEAPPMVEPAFQPADPFTPINPFAPLST